MNVNIGRTIAHERKARGWTQSDFASRLGVTKAAVSKWEVGQSLPDIALLPPIASLFGISLDELFDYRPQLSPDEVDAAVQEVNALLGRDCESGLERCRELAREHASCARLLSALGTVLIASAPACPDRQEPLLDLAERLLDQSEATMEETDGRDDDSLVCGMPLRKHAVMARVSLLTARGEGDAAIRLLERERDTSLDVASALLVAHYENAGRTEDARRLAQETLYRSLQETLQAADQLSRLYPPSDARTRTLSEAANATFEAFGLGFDAPARLVRSAQACRTLLASGAVDRAIEELGRCVAGLERMATEDGGSGRLRPSVPQTFDLLEDRLTGAHPLEGALRTTVVASFARDILSDEGWLRLDDRRVPILLDRLRALE